MSLHKQVALPTTLFDLLKARDEALRLISDASRLLEIAKENLEPYGRSLMPYSARINADMTAIQAELDASMWRRAFDLTGFKQLMDAEAVKSFEAGLHPKPPAFTNDTIRGTFIDLQINAKAMFQRGIFNVFKSLSDDYRTNAKEPFRIGAKVVMRYITEVNWQEDLQVRSDSSQRINDIDRVFQVLDGKTFEPHALVSGLDGAFKHLQVFENDLYRVKGFKNGNLHMEFKRQDLLDKVNEQIAEFYADGALPDARAA